MGGRGWARPQAAVKSAIPARPGARAIPASPAPSTAAPVLPSARPEISPLHAASTLGSTQRPLVNRTPPLRPATRLPAEQRPPATPQRVPNPSTTRGLPGEGGAASRMGGNRTTSWPVPITVLALLEWSEAAQFFAQGAEQVFIHEKFGLRCVVSVL